MTLRETLAQVRSDIADGHANGANEQEAKDWFITPILQALGWRGPSRVRLEHPAGRERVKMDFALQGPDRKIIAFIEAKIPGAELSAHVGQVMNYAFFEGVDICVLTTGVEWWLFLPREKGEPMDRRFAALDLQNDDADQLALLLESCLGYEALTSGEAERHAKDILAARQNEKRLIAELPSAWRRLFDGPNDLLIELVQGEVRKGIGLAPSEQQVAEFLREKAPRAATTNVPSRTSSPRRRVPDSDHPQTTDGQRGRTLAESPLRHGGRSPGSGAIAPKPPRKTKRRNVKVTGFALWGQRYSVRKQYEVLMGVATLLYGQHSDRFNLTLRISVVHQGGPRSTTSSQIGSSSYWIDHGLNFDRMQHACHQLLDAFDYPPTDLKIYVED